MAGDQRHGARHRPQRPVERQLPDEGAATAGLQSELAGGSEDRGSDGDVISGAFLGQIRRGEL